MNIFQIEEEYFSILQELEENGGEITPELEEKLTINRNELEQKLKAYTYLVTLREGDVDIIQGEIKRLQELATQKQNVIDRLKSIMLNAVKLYGDNGKTGNKKLEFPTMKFWTVNINPVKIDDEEKFNNPDFIKYTVTLKVPSQTLEKIEHILQNDKIELFEEPKTEKSIMKKEIKAALEAGQEIEGATIDKEAAYLRIK